MQTIAYSSPFVPPEWIAAHGFRPGWMRLRRVDGQPLVGVSRGVCPFAGAMVDAALAVSRTAGRDVAALVMTTACDQMRYAAAVVEYYGSLPVFLLNVPSTWQTRSVRQLYLDEIGRLGRFLRRHGGRSPTADELAAVMLQYDDARAAFREGRSRRSARQSAEALAVLRSAIPPSAECLGPEPSAGVPLAVVGGPLLQDDFGILDLIEQSGGRVVLDATEAGERTLPAALDRRRTQQHPLEELADAYFGSIPDVFRRPNRRLYEWLGRQLAARQVRGVVFRRYVWCDLWHAELQRLREWSPVPVLELDAVQDDRGAASRTLGQIEAFLELLQ